MTEPQSLRVQKYLAQLGLCSRREAEAWILDGRISVNGEPLVELGRRITPGIDVLSLDQRPLKVKAPPKVYWLYHKPAGVLCSRKSQGDKPTIYDTDALSRTGFFVPTVGRLDYQTEGLLVLTNDGELSRDLAHPSNRVPRRYHALVKKRLSEQEEQRLRNGVELEDGASGRAQLSYIRRQKLGKSFGFWYSITVYEGRNRLVRRLFSSFGADVLRLVRYGFGPLRLPDELEPGTYVQMSSEEIKGLKKIVSDKMNPKSDRETAERTLQ